MSGDGSCGMMSVLLRYGGELCLAVITFNGDPRIRCARSSLFLDDDIDIFGYLAVQCASLLHSLNQSFAGA